MSETQHDDTNASDEEDTGPSSATAGVTPIEHEGDTVKLEVKVKELKTNSNDDVIVIASSDSDQMVHQVALLNPLLDSLSLGDILEVKVRVANP